MFSAGFTLASGGSRRSMSGVDRKKKRKGNSLVRDQLYSYISSRPPDMSSGTDTYRTLTCCFFVGDETQNKQTNKNARRTTTHANAGRVITRRVIAGSVVASSVKAGSVIAGRVTAGK